LSKNSSIGCWRRRRLREDALPAWEKPNMLAKYLITTLAILLLGPVGCGVSEYQSRMDTQRERVKEFDDANRALDDPIEIPSLQLEKPKDLPKDAVKEPAKDSVKDANPAWLFDFYLRLPKGFGSLPKDKVPYFSPFPCFRYAGSESGYDIFVAAALMVDPKAKEKEEFDKYYPDNFRYFVRMAIKDFYFKTNNKLELKMPDKEKYQVMDVKMLSPFSDVTTRIPYKYYEYTDKPSVFRVYIHEEPANLKDGSKEPGKQIAIIVHRPRPPRSDDVRDAFDKAIDACLGTLDATSESMSKRSQYKKLMKR
jgi:hypothetical protein